MKKLKLEELGRLSAEAYRETEKLPVCLLLDNVRSLHNVGAAFRSADAFSAERIILTGITGTPPHREINKTALGATETVDWEYHRNTDEIIRSLKEAGYTIVLVEHTSGSIPLQQYVPTKEAKYCLVFGNEVEGISEGALPLGDVAIEIPQAGTKHSLNVSVCVGILLWEFFRKIKGL